MAPKGKKTFLISGIMKLDMKEFKLGMATVSKDVGKFAKTASAYTAQLSKKFKGLGQDMMLLGGAGMIGALAGFKKIIDMGGNLNDLSNQIGMSTNALSELKYAASLSGIQLDELVRGIGKMQKTLGSGKGADALKTLGLDEKRLKAAAPDQAFTAIIDAIGKIKDQNQRMDLSQSIFGKGGASFLRLAKDGAAGLAALREEARAMGLSFDQANISKLDDMGDNLDRLSGRVAGLGTAFMMQLSPAIEWGIDNVSSMVKWFGDMIGAYPNLVKWTSLGSLGFVALTAVVGTTMAVFSKMLDIWSNGLRIIKDLTGWIGNLVAAKSADTAADTANTASKGANTAATMTAEAARMAEIETLFGSTAAKAANTAATVTATAITAAEAEARAGDTIAMASYTAAVEANTAAKVANNATPIVGGGMGFGGLLGRAGLVGATAYAAYSGTRAIMKSSGLDDAAQRGMESVMNIGHNSESNLGARTVELLEKVHAVMERQEQAARETARNTRRNPGLNNMQEPVY